jgi:pilus assembly protein Flp/PilA
MTKLSYWILRIRDLRDEHGAAAVEYGLLVGLIAVAIIFAVTALGLKLDSLFQDVCEALPVDLGCTAPAA